MSRHKLRAKIYETKCVSCICVECLKFLDLECDPCHEEVKDLVHVESCINHKFSCVNFKRSGEVEV